MTIRVLCTVSADLRMVQAVVRTTKTRMLLLIGLAALLMVPASSADPMDDARNEAHAAWGQYHVAHAWLHHEAGLEEDESTEEPQSQERRYEYRGSSEPEESESEDQDALQAWLLAELAETQEDATDAAQLVQDHLSDLERQAEDAVEEGQAALAMIQVAPQSDAQAAEPQAAQAEEAPPIPTAVVVATVAAAATAGTAFVMFWTAGSTVGTAGTAASGKGTGAGLKRIAPAFSPLFTRFEGKEVLRHPNRTELYGLVAANPGVRLQDLCEETGLSRTAVTHHLRLLEQQHLIVSERMGRSRHYYENGGRYERQKKDAYAILQNDRSKDIARQILVNPGIIQKGLCDALDVRASIVHWHVKRLQEASLVEAVRDGRTVSYFPAGDLRQLTL